MHKRGFAPLHPINHMRHMFPSQASNKKTFIVAKPPSIQLLLDTETSEASCQAEETQILRENSSSPLDLSAHSADGTHRAKHRLVSLTPSFTHKSPSSLLDITHEEIGDRPRSRLLFTKRKNTGVCISPKLQELLELPEVPAENVGKQVKILRKRRMKHSAKRMTEETQLPSLGAIASNFLGVEGYNPRRVLHSRRWLSMRGSPNLYIGPSIPPQFIALNKIHIRIPKSRSPISDTARMIW